MIKSLIALTEASSLKWYSCDISTVPGVVGKSGEVILIGAGLEEAKKKRLGSDHQMTGSELSYQPVSRSF